MARTRPQVMTVTETAADRVREIIADADRPLAGVRVGVRNGGCAGMAYTLDMVETPDPRDEVVKLDGGTVFVDPKAVLFLIGTQMDFRTDKFTSGFVFENPNQVSACGCGESVSLKPADPALAGL